MRTRLAAIISVVFFVASSENVFDFCVDFLKSQFLRFMALFNASLGFLLLVYDCFPYFCRWYICMSFEALYVSKHISVFLVSFGSQLMDPLGIFVLFWSSIFKVLQGFSFFVLAIFLSSFLRFSNVFSIAFNYRLLWWISLYPLCSWSLHILLQFELPVSGCFMFWIRWSTSF